MSHGSHMVPLRFSSAPPWRAPRFFQERRGQVSDLGVFAEDLCGELAEDERATKDARVELSQGEEWMDNNGY